LFERDLGDEGIRLRWCLDVEFLEGIWCGRHSEFNAGRAEDNVGITV